MVHDRNILLTSIMMMIMHYEVLQMKFTIHSKTCTTLHHLIKRNIPFIPNRLGTTSFVLAHPTHIQNTWCAYFFLTWDRIENWFFFVTENRIEKVKKADELTIWLLIYSWTSILSLNNLWFKATCWPWKPTLKTFQNPVILQFIVEALKGHTWLRFPQHILDSYTWILIGPSWPEVAKTSFLINYIMQHLVQYVNLLQ